MNIVETTHRVPFCLFTSALAELLVSLELLMHEHPGSCFLLGLFLALRAAELSVRLPLNLGAGRKGMANTALGGW